ncbi:hypothetical protein SAMN06273572_10557 [Monaibacterium marinum]|uniref:DUF2059 domain-containing protein n=1 Tax=Pontivivens marinum TaxID=1690039 RepID=A0A2C9CTP5_9RHOB|nr:hypothetical protein [Monaibacterium marinum]SOH94637.1 hypothetical protein SAMN06273572_10557 [Monaibacterium marinum]
MLRNTLSSIAVLLMLTIPAYAQEQHQTALAGEVLLLNGFDTLTEDQARALSNAPEGTGDNDPDLATAWDRLGPRFFQAEAVFDAAAEQFGEMATLEELESLRGFFSMGLGQRITALEEASQMPDMDGVDQVELGHAAMAEIDPDRLEALQRLTLAFGTPEEIAATSLNRQFVFQQALNENLGRAIPEADLLAMIITQQDDMIARLQIESVAIKAFIYQSLSVDELNAYAAVIEGGAGQKMYEAVEAAMTEELHSQMRNFAAALGAAVSAENI